MFKTSTRVNRNHDNVIASQLDFARKQSKKKDPEVILKQRKDLDTLETAFKNAKPAEKLMNVKEATEYLQCGDSSLSAWKSMGKGPVSTKVNGSVFYSKKALDDFQRARAKKRSQEKTALPCPSEHEPLRYCETCGGVIAKKKYYPKTYRKMKYCCIQCVAKRDRETTPETEKPAVETQAPIELKTPVPASKWGEIKTTMEILGVSEKSIANYKKIYDLGFRHGSGE